jgi:leader peptidase (prepilin peptidase) / N-methyltransferase
MRAQAAIGAAAGASAFVGADLLAGSGTLTLARLALLGAALSAIAIYDLRERRIPNLLVFPAAISCGTLTLAAGSALPLVAGLVIVALLLATSLCWPRALGMGDVKLALLLVVALDGSALRALAVGLTLATLASLTTLARHGREGRRLSLPLARFLAAGALIAILPWASG